MEDEIISLEDDLVNHYIAIFGNEVEMKLPNWRFEHVTFLSVQDPGYLSFISSFISRNFVTIFNNIKPNYPVFTNIKVFPNFQSCLISILPQLFWKKK